MTRPFKLDAGQKYMLKMYFGSEVASEIESFCETPLPPSPEIESVDLGPEFETYRLARKAELERWGRVEARIKEEEIQDFINRSFKLDPRQRQFLDRWVPEIGHNRGHHTHYTVLDETHQWVVQSDQQPGLF